MKGNKHKSKGDNKVADDLKDKGFVYLVKNPASNEITLCAFEHTLKCSEAVIYETRYGLDLGFVIGDASRLGKPYEPGSSKPCGACCFKAKNMEKEDDQVLVAVANIDNEGNIKVDDEVEKEDEEVILFRDYSNLENQPNDKEDDDKKIEVSDDAVWIERVATKEDLKRYKELCDREEDALTLCREKIKKHNLDMKLVTAHFLLVEPKVVFFFTADVRVDFRELVKDLVSIFRIRIELRQIGVRDESRLLGGLAVCGRDYCCHCITDKLSPVSIKMAKEQNLSLNSIKISGPCGRLLCCLSYEQDFYSEEKLKYPPEGTKLKMGRELWKVNDINILSKKMTLQGPEGGLMVIDGSKVYFNSDSGFWVIEKEYLRELLAE